MSYDKLTREEDRWLIDALDEAHRLVRAPLNAGSPTACVESTDPGVDLELVVTVKRKDAPSDLEETLRELAGKTVKKTLFLGGPTGSDEITRDYQRGLRDTIRFLYGLEGLRTYDEELDRLNPEWEIAS